MTSGQHTNNMDADALDNEEGNRFSVVLSPEHNAKLIDLMTERGLRGNTSGIPKATAIRCLIELSTMDVEFLGVIRLLIDNEKASRRQRRQKGQRRQAISPFPIVLAPKQRKRMGELTGYCLANGLNCGHATVIRGLIVVAEPSPDFTQALRALHDREREKWFELQRDK